MSKKKYIVVKEDAINKKTSYYMGDFTDGSRWAVNQIWLGKKMSMKDATELAKLHNCGFIDSSDHKFDKVAIKQALSKIDELTKEQGRLNHNLGFTTDSFKRCCQQRKELCADCTNLEKTKNELESRLAEAEKKGEWWHRQFKEAVEDCRMSLNDKEKMLNELTQAQAKLEKLQGADFLYTAAVESNGKLLAEREVLRQENNKLKDENTKLNDFGAGVSDEVERLVGDVYNLNTENISLKITETELTKENNSLEKKVLDCQIYNNHLRWENKNLHAEINRLMARIKESNKKEGETCNRHGCDGVINFSSPSLYHCDTCGYNKK
jgi:chromosome segregation ATPase